MPGLSSINPPRAEKNTDCRYTKNKRPCYACPYHLWDILWLNRAMRLLGFSSKKKRHCCRLKRFRNEIFFFVETRYFASLTSRLLLRVSYFASLTSRLLLRVSDFASLTGAFFQDKNRRVFKGVDRRVLTRCLPISPRREGARDAKYRVSTFFNWRFC